MEAVVAAALAEAREAGDVDAAEDEGTGVAEVVEETSDADASDDATEEDADGDEKPAAKKVKTEAKADEDEDADDKGEKKKPVDGEEDEDEDAKAAKVKADADAKAAADKKAKDEKDEDAELGPERDAKGKINKIPHPQVQKIVKNAEKKLIGEVVTSLGLNAEKTTRETLPVVLKNIVAHVRGLQGRVKFMDEVGPIMEKDAKAFITRLSEAWPDIYNPVLDAMAGKGSAVSSPTIEALGEEPGPDVPITLPDGSKGMTFSVAGMKKRDEWRDAKLLAQVDERLGKRFEPLDKAEKTRKDNDALRTQIKDEMDDILADAQTWDGFKEHEKEIFDAWQASDPNIPMRKAINAAYQKIVVKKYKDGAINARAAALKELAEAPDSTAAVTKNAKSQKEVVRGEGGAVVTGTEAIIRKELARAKAAGKV